jgi:glycosyltransferase involved in cell wall biosynthesis
VTPARVALLLDKLGVGGTQRMTLQLAAGLHARGHRVALLLCSRHGLEEAAVPAGVSVHVLGTVPGRHVRRLALRTDPAGLPHWSRALLGGPVPAPLRCVPALAEYLLAQPPDALIASKTYPNLAALWAQRLCGAPVPVVVTERTHLSARCESAKARWRGAPPLVRRYYPRAAAVLAISDGIAEDLVRAAGLPRERVVRVPNPVIGPEFGARARAPVAHAWLATPEVPVVLAVGNLTPQKDYPTFLRAFAHLRQRLEARLLVLGEGPERPRLEALIGELGIGGDTHLPGTVATPEAYMARAAVLVLASRYEGFGNVLVEALAAGCPVVATDCRSGPAEILAGGRFGALVPVGDAPALAAALERQLAHAPDPEPLRRRGGEYSLGRSLEAYAAVLSRLGAAFASGSGAAAVAER